MMKKMINGVRVRDVAEVVKDILETKPKTREDDNLLIYEVIDVYDTSKTYVYFVDVLCGIRDRVLPTFCSITRARRKIQELYPELRANSYVEGERTDKTAEYINFALGERA